MTVLYNPIIDVCESQELKVSSYDGKYLTELPVTRLPLASVSSKKIQSRNYMSLLFKYKIYHYTKVTERKFYFSKYREIYSLNMSPLE